MSDALFDVVIGVLAWVALAFLLFYAWVWLKERRR